MLIQLIRIQRITGGDWRPPGKLCRRRRKVSRWRWRGWPLAGQRINLIIRSGGDARFRVGETVAREIVLEREIQKVHAAGLFIVEKIRQGKAIDAIVSGMCTAFDIDAAQCTDDVRDFVGELRSRQLLLEKGV